MKPKTQDSLDLLVDEILEIATNSKKLDKILSILENQDSLESKNYNEIIGLKERVSNIEIRLNKLIESFKTTAIEAEREITERHEKILGQLDKQILSLQGQIEDLRTALIRISNEVKNLKERL